MKLLSTPRTSPRSGAGSKVPDVSFSQVSSFLSSSWTCPLSHWWEGWGEAGKGTFSMSSLSLSFKATFVHLRTSFVHSVSIPFFPPPPYLTFKCARRITPMSLLQERIDPLKVSLTGKLRPSEMLSRGHHQSLSVLVLFVQLCCSIEHDLPSFLQLFLEHPHIFSYLSAWLLLPLRPWFSLI